MEKFKTPRINNILLVAIIGAVAVLSILSAIKSNERWAGYLHLMREGSHCQAVVTKTDNGSDGLAEYSFNIGGRNYFGTGQNCRAGIGQTVTVTYLVEDPSHSCLGNPGERLANEVISFLVGGLSFPSLS